MRLDRLRRAVTENSASTDPDAEDPHLRGRTYAIAFDRVWNAALELAHGGLRGWEVVRWDDQEGMIEAVAKTLVFRFTDDVTIHVGLDENAQTRVDVESGSRKGRADLGANRRRIAKFMRSLDDAVDARPDQILDPRATLQRVA